MAGNTLQVCEEHKEAKFVLVKSHVLILLNPHAEGKAVEKLDCQIPSAERQILNIRCQEPGTIQLQLRTPTNDAFTVLQLCYPKVPSTNIPRTRDFYVGTGVLSRYWASMLIGVLGPVLGISLLAAIILRPDCPPPAVRRAPPYFSGTLGTRSWRFWVAVREPKL